jgi:hypothetical protein
MQEKGDELIKKNKALHQKNKGMPSAVTTEYWL